MQVDRVCTVTKKWATTAERKRKRDAANAVSGKRRQADRELTLALAARAYTRALNRGSRRANVDVARELGISPPQARDHIHRARPAGLLTATSKIGVPGGELTEKCTHLLGAVAGAIGHRLANERLKSGPCQYIEFYRDILVVLAERVGFEPTVRFPVHTLSKRAPSTTRTSLRVFRISSLQASG